MQAHSRHSNRLRIHRYALFAIFISSTAFAEDPQISPYAPEDKPVSGSFAAFNAAIAPYVAEAKRTFPIAKSKFEHGLSKGQSFFITTRLHDSSGAIEQVFIAVNKIEGGIVYGKIWSKIELVDGYKLGGLYQFPESEMLDWLITHPDGSEEGNVVGKFLDSYGSNGR